MKIIKFAVMIISFFEILTFARAETMQSVVSGGGRDSLKYYVTSNDPGRIAEAFNILLEDSGEAVVEKAEKYVSGESDPVVRSYIYIVLADYYSVNDNLSESIHYLKKAVAAHNQIRTENYYYLVFSRLQKNIEQSPGIKADEKATLLAKYNPRQVDNSMPPIPLFENTVHATDSSFAVAETASRPESVPETQPVEAEIPNNSDENNGTKFVYRDIYRIQIGAFSRRANAKTLQEKYEKAGYSVIIVERKKTDSSLFIVRLGEYDSYSRAKSAFRDLKKKYPGIDGYVTKVKP